MGVFRYVDRWQTSIRELWHKDDPRHDQMLALLEQRDRDLEDWLLCTSQASCGYFAQFSTAGSDGTLTDATLDTLYLGTEYTDTDGFATAGSSSAVTIPTGKSGVYAVTVHCEQTASGTGTDGYMAVLIGGGYSRTLVAPAFSAQGTYELSATLRLAAGDTLTTKIRQNSGADKTLSSYSFIVVERVVPL